jgi:hypothetical protein
MISFSLLIVIYKNFIAAIVFFAFTFKEAETLFFGYLKIDLAVTWRLLFL